MILSLYGDTEPPAPLEHLQARRTKDDQPKRGAIIAAPFDGTPLAALAEKEKLHIVAPADGDRVAGHTAEELVELLLELGLPRGRRLKQIHFIADHAGSGDETSYAARFAAAAAAKELVVEEIKAPCCAVRWDANGKVHIRAAGGAFVPSSSSLNLYIPPR